MTQEQIQQMHIIRAQIEQMQQYLAAVQQQTEDLAQAQDCLEELRTVKEGEEILVPIANGIFLKASIKDSKNFLTNVGAGVITSSSSTQAQKLLADQMKELEQLQEEITRQFSELYQQYLSFQLSGEE